MSCAVANFVGQKMAADPARQALTQLQIAKMTVAARGMAESRALIDTPLEVLASSLSQTPTVESHASYACSAWLFAIDHAAGCRACSSYSKDAVASSASSSGSPSSSSHDGDDAVAARAVTASDDSGDDAMAGGGDETAGASHFGSGSVQLSINDHLEIRVRKTTERFARTILPGRCYVASKACPITLLGTPSTPASVATVTLPRPAFD